LIAILVFIYYRNLCMYTYKGEKMGFKTINLLFIVLVLFISCSKKEEQPRLLVPDIPVFETQAQEVPIYQEFVGQVYGYKDIAIRARVEGFLEEIPFQEGSPIAKDTLLYTLESQQFEADVAAKMSRVAEAQTMLAKAQSDLNRIKPLAEEKAVSESDLDASVAQHEASIESVKAAEANLRASKIQLGYTKIYSPIFGIIGKTKAKVGDFVLLTLNLFLKRRSFTTNGLSGISSAQKQSFLLNLPGGQHLAKFDF